MKKNNPKIDKIMNRGAKKPSRESKLLEIVRVLGIGTIVFIVGFGFMVLGDMLSTRHNNLMAPIDCLQVMNKGLRHDEVGVTPKKCDFFKEQGIIKYDVESDYWVLVNPNENNK